jgi:hypothetical protein
MPWVGFFFVLAVSAGARAQAPARSAPLEPKIDGSGPDYTVEFDDDALNALGQGLLIPRIVVRPRVPRTTLIRPRTSFRNELLKTAEAI